jgi:hypothetical protein
MLVEASLSPAFLLALTLYQAIPLSYVAFERRLEKDQRNCSIFSSFAHQGKMGNVSAKINATVFHFKPRAIITASHCPLIQSVCYTEELYCVACRINYNYISIIYYKLFLYVRYLHHQLLHHSLIIKSTLYHMPHNFV